MSLKSAGVIEIPGAAGSAFDHGIFDTKSRRVFIAHTAKSTIEVIDPDAERHVATLPGFPGAAGAVADDGEILVTNRGSASLAWVDAATLKTRSVLSDRRAAERCGHRQTPLARDRRLHRRRERVADTAGVPSQRWSCA